MPRLLELTLLFAVLLPSLPAAAAGPPRLQFRPHQLATAGGGEQAVDLGELRVPENRSDPASRTIVLRLVRFKATTPHPGSPIVYLAGGPGGSGIAAARGSRLPLFLALREHGDVIAFDQRGTGEDAETDCDEEYLIDPSQPSDRAQVGATIAAAVRRCAQRLASKGIDLAAYTTRESAADLDDLRRALGVEKLTLWGISYGTHLALATLKAYPDRIDRLLLAGIENLDEAYKLPSDQQELLATIAALAQPQMPDLLASIRSVRRALEAEPRRVPLTHPLTGQTAIVTLGPLDLQVAIADMLAGPDSFAVLPDLVSRLERGDWTALALLKGRLLQGEAPNAMAVAMDCASGATAQRRARIAAEVPETLLGDAINLPFPEICAGLTVPDLGDDFRAALRSEVPALLISGTLDGRTRPRQAEALMLGLPNAVHLVIEGAGHSDPLFLSSPKILETMQRFLRGEPVAERRVVLPPVRLVTPRTVIELPAESLARYVGEYRLDGGGVRRVLQAGSVLYTLRDRSLPFPIRPSSPTEFFYEASAATIRFESDDRGRVTAMLFRPGDGREERCPRVKAKD